MKKILFLLLFYIFIVSTTHAESTHWCYTQGMLTGLSSEALAALSYLSFLDCAEVLLAGKSQYTTFPQAFIKGAVSLGASMWLDALSLKRERSLRDSEDIEYAESIKYHKRLVSGLCAWIYGIKALKIGCNSHSFSFLPHLSPKVESAILEVLDEVKMYLNRTERVDILLA